MENKQKELSPDEIRRHLVNKDLQNIPIFYYDETDSTNERAKAFAKDGGTRAIFIAEKQTAGRGRMGRRFESDDGVGIYMSFLVFPNILPKDASRLTISAAVSVVRAVESLCNLSVQIKWVNDVMYKGRKLSGILTEGRAESEDHLSYAIVGIGINVYKRSFSSEIADIATSIEEASGLKISRSQLAAKIIDDFFTEYSFAETLKFYEDRSYILGKEITVFGKGEPFLAKAVGLSDKGELIIEKPDGTREYLSSGEVSVREFNKSL